MQKGNYLSAILRSNKTVFSTKDVSLLWQDPNSSATRVRLNYYSKKGSLYHIRKGLYGRDQKYNRLELASRIMTPSYVSFETVLEKEGIIFQYHSQVTVASYTSREINVDNQTYIFKKIRTPILVNPLGIEQKDGVAIASRERAFLDILYINKDYHFDNLRSIDWDKVFEILPIYKNKRLVKLVNKYYTP